MKLSIIIPVYNTERYLKRCVDSVLHAMQSADFEYEIILVNDGSTDNSLEMCKRYRAEYDEIELIDQNNKGLSGARNSGISLAKGKFIVFVDSDDYIDDALVKAVEEIDEKKLQYGIFGYYELNQNRITVKGENTVLASKDYHEVSDEQKIAILRDTNGLSPVWHQIISREFLLKKELYFKEGFLHEDYDWTLRAVLEADNILLSERRWYYYINDRVGSIMNTRKYKSLESIILLSKQILNDYEGLLSPRLLSCVKESISNACFGVVRFIPALEQEDQKKLYKLLKENDKLLSYSKKTDKRAFYLISRILGLKATVGLTHRLHQFR